jgi:hypothetical protein
MKDPPSTYFGRRQHLRKVPVVENSPLADGVARGIDQVAEACCREAVDSGKAGEEDGARGK